MYMYLWEDDVGLSCLAYTYMLLTYYYYMYLCLFHHVAAT